MQNVTLKIYVSEKQRHNGKLVYEWLLEEARKLGVPGGSAFRAVAGFGRHGRMHEETFIELAGELPMQVEFVLDEILVEKLLAIVRPHKLNLFYMRHAVESGVV
jgi:PII-like signaling protein